VAGKMVHQTDEEGQVFARGAGLVDRQDVAIFRSLEKEIGVGYAFGNALEGQGRPEVVGLIRL
jgi:hypothetical protein